MIPSSACRYLQTHEDVILSWVQTGTGISNHIPCSELTLTGTRKPDVPMTPVPEVLPSSKRLAFERLVFLDPSSSWAPEVIGMAKVKPVLRHGKVSHSLLPQHFERISLIEIYKYINRYYDYSSSYYLLYTL